jgi:hypothetical protein
MVNAGSVPSVDALQLSQSSPGQNELPPLKALSATVVRSHRRQCVRTFEDP